MNRLTRDQLIVRALDLADIPALDQHDRPSAPTIASDAYTIGWLQEGIDWFHQQVPMAGILTSTSITITTTGSVTLPTTFIVDMRDGVVVTSPEPRSRLRRISMQDYVARSVMNATTAAATRPTLYAVQPGNLLFVNRQGVAPDQSYTAKLWYYALPAALASSTVPNFPSDLTLTEYLQLKCKEWVRAVPAGTALAYAKARVAEIQKNGLFNEPEDYTIPFDDTRILPQGDLVLSPYDWMGDW